MRNLDSCGYKPKLWERQENEGLQAFEAFTEYRDMGIDRSLAKVGRKLGKSTSLIERWSKKFSWVVRIEAWTDEQDRLTRESLVRGVTAMRKAHTDIAGAMLEKAEKALKKLPPDGMTPRDIATLVDVAAKLERLSRGEATERTQVDGNVSASVNAIKIVLPDNGTGGDCSGE